MINDFLSAPMEISVAMGLGYVGYFIAHIGRKDHHKQTDIILSTAVFGLISMMIYREVYRNHHSDVLAVLASLGMVSLLAAIWNGFGRSYFAKILRSARVTYSDDLPSAWRAIPEAKGVYAEQLSVKLIDGTWLHCDDMSKFEESPNRSCVFGGEGDLLMYVTHVKAPGANEYVEKVRVKDNKYGDLITYLPKSQIARVEFRRSKQSVV